MEILNKVYTIRPLKKCTDSTSSKIPTPEPYLPYETMLKTLMEALCGKESEHWKKAWEFEMYRATLKRTWENVEEEEYTISDINLYCRLQDSIYKGVGNGKFYSMHVLVIYSYSKLF